MQRGEGGNHPKNCTSIGGALSTTSQSWAPSSPILLDNKNCGILAAGENAPDCRTTAPLMDT